MTNAKLIAKIKAEIKRRIKILREDEIVRQNCTSDFLEGKIYGYEEVLSFLDTIELEKPVTADLEEAAEHYASVTDPEAHGVDFIREVFIGGAEWDREHMQEWSKEDEEILHKIKQCIYDNVANIGTVNKVKYINWLESLCP